MGTWEGPGQSDEWYTPKYIFEALDVVFDMDVAHPAPPSVTAVPAAKFLYEDSLAQPWEGLIWMNPPFGKGGSIKPWLRKFFDHGNGIALTADSTSAQWFRDAWAKADLVMFMPRVKFVKPDGSLGANPANGTCLWACGRQATAALRRASAQDLGILAQPL